MSKSGLCRGTTCPSLLPTRIDKDVLDYDNIYPNMYKIGASFDPEKCQMVDVSQLQNMDYGFEAYATQAFNAPDGRALAVSWLGLPDVSYPSDRFDHQGTFSLVKELTIKDGKLYQYPVAAIKDLRASEEASQTVPKPRTLTNLNSTWKLIARARLSTC